MVSLPLPAKIAVASINLPDSDLLLLALEDREHLEPLLHQWLEAYRAQLGDEFFSIERFMDAARTRLAALHPDNKFELGAYDYEYVKKWVFLALRDVSLQQSRNITGYDEDGEPVFGNLIQLKAAQS